MKRLWTIAAGTLIATLAAATTSQAYPPPPPLTCAGLTVLHPKPKCGKLAIPICLALQKCPLSAPPTIYEERCVKWRCIYIGPIITQPVIEIPKWGPGPVETKPGLTQPAMR